MSKAPPPPAEVYAPNPPDYSHGYAPHGYHPGPHQQPPPQGNHATYSPVTHQPMAQSTNVVVNLGGAGGGKSDNRKRQWTTDLCGCCQDIQSCLCAWFLTPCFLAQLASQMDECICMPFCVPTALIAMRVKVRESNRIQGSICQDCMCTTCCPLLAMCQMKRELDNVAMRKPGTEL